MEKGTEIRASEMELDQRYSFSPLLDPIYNFIVVKIDKHSVHINMRVGDGLILIVDQATYYCNPYTELEKALL